MDFSLGPTVGQWYRMTDTEERFMVLAVDHHELQVRVQFADRERLDIEFSEWELLDLEEAEEPQDWQRGSSVKDIDRWSDEADELTDNVDSGENEVEDEDDWEDDDLDDDEEDDEDDWDDDLDDDEEDDEDDWDDDLDEDEDDDDEDNEPAAAEPSANNDWRSGLRGQVEQEVEKLIRNDRRRESLIANRLQNRRAASELLASFVEQVGREEGVLITGEALPLPSYRISVEDDPEWFGSLQLQDGRTEGTWRVLLESGRSLRRLPELESYLRDELMRSLAARLAPRRAQQRREEERARRARVQAYEAQQEAERKLQAARKVERELDYEARMRARSPSAGTEKKK